MIEWQVVLGIVTTVVHIMAMWTAVSVIAAVGWAVWRSPSRAHRLALEDAQPRLNVRSTVFPRVPTYT